MLLDYGVKRAWSRLPVWTAQARTVLKREGLNGLISHSLRKVYRYIFYSGDPHRLQGLYYNDWKRNIEGRYLNENYIKKLSTKIKIHPKFSIIFPTWNKSARMLRSALDSIIDQYYENWEICISEGSSKYIDETKEVLESYKKKYGSKVKVSYLEERKPINLIENTNNALSMATGEYCVFMDCDDELSKNCLIEIVWAIQNNPDSVLFYSDFDKIDLEGNRFDPSFWPDWSPHSILSQMYTTHVTCYKTSSLRDLGGLRKGTVGAQDWDLVLRLSEHVEPDQIVHIPKILYHWRLYPGSTALSGGGAKEWVYDSQKKVLEDWMKRNKETGEVLEGKYKGSWRIKFEIKDNPKVSIIIPFRDQVDYLKRCVKSIEDKTQYRNYEVILVDNQSELNETLDYLDTLKNKYDILMYDKPYHFGRINNWAVGQVDSDHILFLNNDTEVINNGWLCAMLEYSQRKEVGAVGTKLLYPNGKIQHVGVIVGLGGAAAHSHRMLGGDSFGYNGWIVNVMNYMAVTASCMMVKRKLFLEEGGFDLVFDPAYQDIDFCIRLYEHGYWNVYTPYAQLYHYESVTRFSKRNKVLLAKDEDNAEKLRKRWPKYMGIDFGNDPFYNPNLSYAHEDFRLKTDWYPEDWGKRVGLVV